MDKQTGKLVARISENLPEMDRDVMQGWIDNPKGLQKFLLGLNPSEATPASMPPMDFIIRVDRLVKPTYPDWFKKLVYPKLECKGPAEYDLRTVKLWLHDNQKKDIVSGNTIFYCLREDNAFVDCLGLEDLLAIQQKGIKVFHKLYMGEQVLGWRSVVQNSDGNLRVPYLCESNGEIVLGWAWVDDDWNCYRPALLFSK